jgi:6-phosphogluconolactonase (cycloisomerase 2 family)
MMRAAQPGFLVLPILVGAYALCGCSPHFDFSPPPTYTVGGTVTGLVGNGLTFSRNGSSIGRGANGRYPDLGLGPLSPGQAYDVAVITQPTNPSQTCLVANGQGTIGNANITNVQVACTTHISRYAYVANGSSNSISAYTIDAASGGLTPAANLPVSAAGPYFVAMDPFSRYLYVTNSGSNSLSVYAIDAGNGALTAVGGSPFPTGSNPNSVSVHPSGTLVYVTNQSDATISAYAQDPASAALTAVPGSPFPSGSNPACVTAPDYTNPLFDEFVYAGAGSNSIWAYTIVTQGTALSGALKPMAGTPFAAGSHPVSMAADPAGNFFFVANGGDGTVSAYSVDPASGSLTPIAGSPFAAGRSPASAAVDPLGRYLYVANRSDGTISAYRIDAGALRAVAGSPFTAGSGPSSVAVDNLGQFLFVVNDGSNDISAYAINAATGALAPIAGSPFASGSGPTSIVLSN